MLETSDQFYAVDSLELWYRKYNHQVIDLAGIRGTGKFEIIKTFIERIGFKDYQVMFLSLNQEHIISLAQKQYHAYYLKHILYDYYKKYNYDTIRLIEPNSLGLEFEWKKERNKKINKAYKLIVVLDAELCSIKIIGDLMKFHLPIILVSDPLVVGTPESYLKIHEPNILVKDITDSNQKNPINHFITKILNKDTIPYGNFKSVSVLKKTDSNIFNFKFSDMIIAENQESVNQLNRIYREKIMKYKTTVNHPGERLILTEDSHQFIENRTENKIKFFLDQNITGTITKIDQHSANRKFINIDFKPDGYTDIFQGIILDRFFLNKFSNRSIAYPFGPLLKFDYAYAITALQSQYGNWNDVTVIEEPYDDWDYHARVLYTGISRAKKSIILIR